MKAKDFWNFLCEGMDYRFFAGVPCQGLMPLYNTMHPKFMHYIPAVREGVALALASGANISGAKAAVLMRFDRICSVLDYVISFNKVYGVPVLILAFDECNNKDLKKLLTSQKIPYKTLKNIKKDLSSLTKTMTERNIPAVAILEEGAIE